MVLWKKNLRRYGKRSVVLLKEIYGEVMENIKGCTKKQAPEEVLPSSAQ